MVWVNSKCDCRLYYRLGRGVQMHHHCLIVVDGDIFVCSQGLQIVSLLFQVFIIRFLDVHSHIHSGVLHLLLPMGCVSQGVVNEDKETKKARFFPVWHTARERQFSGIHTLKPYRLLSLTQEICKPSHEVWFLHNILVQYFDCENKGFLELHGS